MNERMAGESGMPVRTDEPGIQRTGCDGADGCYYFTRQAISQFIQGGVSSTLMERQHKSPDDLIVNELDEKPPCIAGLSGKKKRKYIIRRLTPTECLRLQGLPDWWCDGVKKSDSKIYKMAGNGIALPCAIDILGRIANEIRKEESS